MMEKEGDRQMGEGGDRRVKVFFDKGLRIQSLEPFSMLALLETPPFPTRDELTPLLAPTCLSSWPRRDTPTFL